MDSGGYNVRLIKNEVPQPLACFFCKFLMKNTIQTCRGERACHICYTNEQSKLKPGICPIDGEPDTNFFPDKFADKEIGEISCYCPNWENGCEEILKIKELLMHEDVCNWTLVLCEECKESMFRSQLSKHTFEHCPKRKISCPYCNEEVPFDEKTVHDSSCDKRPKFCPYGCGDILVDKKPLLHSSECSKILSGEACRYQVLGCNNAKIHENHDTIILPFIESLQEKCELLEKKSTAWEERTHSASESLRSVQEKLDVLENTHVELEKKWAGFEQNIKIEMDAMHAKMIQWKDDLSEEFKQKGNTSTAGNGCQGCNSKIEQLENSHSLLNKNLADLDLRQQLLENTSYNGEMFWRIDDFEHRTNQARIGRVTVLHSAPSFTRKNGYKYCCRVYLNGDGMAKKTHLSIFFVLMKSDLDTILDWPFRERVTFRLLHPTESSRNIQETFLPDPTSPSFRKPVKNMNVAAGCPLFVSHELLYSGDYISENCIYLELKIG